MEVIERIGIEVISQMIKMPELSKLPVERLNMVPLGKLRKNCKTMLGCCRFKKDSRWVKKNQKGEIIERGKDFWPYENTLAPEDVKRIDLHPDLLQPEWKRMAASVLYHEYLHALGFRHCPTFRKLESLWPDKGAILGTRKAKLRSEMYNLWINRKIEN